ncbi:MAG: endo-1,4-beta-xylanase [Planctomycetes bacterium]|nr:endo-1,4-beta-xylanase [Planctomycetota bacterium]
MTALRLLAIILAVLPLAAVELIPRPGDDGLLTANRAWWRCWLPGAVRPDAGTIEVAATPDRPIEQLGNDWEFLFSVPAARTLSKTNRLLAVFVPPAPERGLSAVLRTASATVRVNAPDFTWTAGRPLVLGLSWGAELALWADGRAIARTPLDGTPPAELWGDRIELPRWGAFRPATLRIATVERAAATSLAADRDTSLLAHADGRVPALPPTPWQAAGNGALVQPAWRAERLWLAQDAAAALPLVAANPTGRAIDASITVHLQQPGGAALAPVAARAQLPPGSAAQVLLLPLGLPRPAGRWPFTWRIEGAGLPTLSGAGAVARWPHDAAPADGELARFYGVHHEGDIGIAASASLGVAATRAWAGARPFLWHRIEPVPGAFSWQEADAYVDECTGAGLEILGVLGYPARWAAREPPAAIQARHPYGPRPERWTPADPAAWARYVGETVARYRGRVRAWEVWNEVNFHPPVRPGSFSGSTGEYLELQRLAYRAAKAADPGCLVTTSGFSTEGDRELPAAALAGGLAEVADVLNVHGYGGVEGPAAWLADWRRRRPGAPAWQGEQMWFQVADPQLRQRLTAAAPLLFAAAGYQRFHTMGLRELYADPATLSPTDDLWTTAVLLNELRPCRSFAGLAPLPAGAELLLHHRFARSDGSVLTAFASERGALRIALAGRPLRVRGLDGADLPWTVDGDGCALAIDGGAWVVSASPLEVRAIEALGGVPGLFNPGFEELDGDIAMAGTAAGRARGFELRERRHDPAGRIRPSEEARSGRYAMEVSGAGAGKVYLVQEARGIATGRYVLGGWFRRSAGDGRAVVSCYDARSRVLKQALAPVGGDRGWRHLALEIDIPADHGPLMLSWGLGQGAGTLLVDDVSFLPAERAFDHARVRALDLAAVANQALRDQVAGDGRGGFADLGPDDLRLLPAGEERRGGGSFRILDDAGGTRPALVMLAGGPRRALPAEAAIPLAGRAAAIDLLLTALHVGAAPGAVLATARVDYADGAAEELPLLRGRDLDDWYRPRADPALAPALELLGPDRSGRALYRAAWTNPRPRAELRRLTLRSSGTAIVVLAAASAVLP